MTKLFKEAVLPAVQIRDKNEYLGSGVILSSKKRKNSIETYVLTNEHTIRSLVSYEEIRDCESETVETVSINETCFVDVVNYDEHDLIYSYTANISEVIYYGSVEDGTDFAILKLNDTKNIYNEVNFSDLSGNDLEIGEEVWAVGSVARIIPTITHGILSCKNVRALGQDLYLVTTPIYYGSSGCPVYRFNFKNEKYEMIGIISFAILDLSTDLNSGEDKKEETGDKENDDSVHPIIFHMAHVIPLSLIYTKLQTVGLEYIIDDKKIENLT